MRRGRVLIFLLLIVVIGLVVVFVAFRTLLQARPQQAQAPVTVQVFKAGQNISQGESIPEDKLATFDLPQDQVTVEEFTLDEKSQLVGKIAKFPISQGTVITSAMVTDSSEAVPIAGPQWAALIPPGMVAAPLPASRLSTVAYGVNDGAHVNLIACMLFVDVDPSFQSITPDNTATLTATGFPQGALPILSLGVGATGGALGRLELDQSLQQPFYLQGAEPQRARPVCQTILQNAVVMKLGNFPLTTTNPQAAQQQTQQQQQGAAPAPDIITLIVSPQDANTLSWMMYTNVQLVMNLRNPSDQSRLATEAATLQFALSQYNIPVPAKLPYATQPRIDALTAPALTNGASTASP